LATIAEEKQVKVRFVRQRRVSYAYAPVDRLGTIFILAMMKTVQRFDQQSESF
jgi:hypothetical protein